MNALRPGTDDYRQENQAVRRVRLFLALWPGAHARARLLAYQRQCVWPRAAVPVAAGRLHLTLHFIGEVERASCAHVAAGLRVAMRPFDLALTRAEIWPRGIALLAAPEIPEALQQLHADLTAALRRLELPVETRAFRPHLTLARHAMAAILPSEPPSLYWRVDDYVLVESVLGAGGGYRLLQRYP